jgi:transketolase
MSAVHAMSPVQIRRIVLTQSKRANVGHIGSCLSVVDILAALYGGVLQASPADPDRDRFVLSKGHAALALYAALMLKGWIRESDLDTFCCDDSHCGVHPEHALAGVDFSTGSLGHGLSLAAGAALAARMQGSARRAFCLLSDGELNEGSVWEAVMFAAHHKLGRLVAIVDVNGQQAFGHTRDVIDLADLAGRFRAFGWRVSDVDGHAIGELTNVLSASSGDTGLPHVVLAKTVFGKGVSFMEQGHPGGRPGLAQHTINWHYLPMNDAEFADAMKEVDADPGAPKRGTREGG